MALNWVMLDEAGRKPLPLPEESILCAVHRASLQLQFSAEKVTYKAEGDAMISSHRFVFIRQPRAAQSEGMLDTLSVPLDHFHNYRYTIPVFAAPYLEADVYPVHEGGLPQRQTGSMATPVGKLKIWFMESGGVAFRDGVDQGKRLFDQLQQSAQDQDALPPYEPPPLH